MPDCPNCHRPLTPGNREYCGQCGAWLPKSFEPSPEPAWCWGACFPPRESWGGHSLRSHPVPHRLPPDPVLEWLRDFETKNPGRGTLYAAIPHLIARRRAELEGERDSPPPPPEDE